MEPRPLDFGRMFDRAISLYTRHFASFIGIAAIAVVPVAVVQYAVELREAPQLEAALDLLQHPDRLHTGHVPVFGSGPLTLAAAVVVFGYVIWAFATGAVGMAVARVYGDEPVDMRACYRAALHHWTAVLAVVITALLILVAAYGISVMAALIPILVAASLSMASAGAVTLIVLPLLLVFIAFVMLVLLVVSACTVFAIVIEDCSASAAWRLTAERVLNRAEFGRALLCGLAVGAIAAISITLIDTIGFAGLDRVPAAYVALDATVRALVITFLVIFLAVYYFDVRRRAGAFTSNGLELAAGPDEPVYAPTAYLSGEERATIKRFLERREAMTAQRRRTIAAALAAPVRSRVPEPLARLDDESLLERL